MPFDSFIGNHKAVQRLRTKLHERRFPHGLIFAGPEGVGKLTLATSIAKTLNCKALNSNDFCGECSSCARIDSGTYPDVMTVTVEDDATLIKIAQVRQVLSTLEFKAMEGSSKVFIINPANLLNAEAANALLKALEEPPDNSYFILITVNIQELLLTIRSRCQVYHFSPLTLDEIRAQGITDELVVRWSQGSIGRARSLDAAAIKQQREPLLSFLESSANANDETFREMLTAGAELSRARQDFAGHLSILAILLGDLMLLAENLPERVVNIDIQDRLQRLALSVPSDRWPKVADFLRTMELSMKGNINRQILTDVLSLVTAGIS